jgi:two-component system, cell cycle sensor histidine kinase and response regulator CckA
MPGLTGLDLARRAKEVRPDLPIVVITGYSERVTPESCRQAGVHDYLLKPIVGADLSKAIQAAIAASRG